MSVLFFMIFGAVCLLGFGMTVVMSVQQSDRVIELLNDEVPGLVSAHRRAKLLCQVIAASLATSSAACFFYAGVLYD